MSMKELWMKAPGRIVFFGEHQDYLGLPVIPAAIDLYMDIRGKLSKNSYYYIKLPDLRDEQFFQASNIKYTIARDYLKSGVKILQREGIIPKNQGVIAKISSKIPMQVGLSSSSALNVIWIAFLAEIFKQSLKPMELTKLAHRAEVVEFGEPGGMQDHMAISHGFMNYEEFDPIRCTRLKSELSGIVIGNSLEKKDTLDTLVKIKNGVKNGLNYFGVQHVKDLSLEDINNELPKNSILDQFSFKALKAAVTNFEITRQAYLEFQKSSLNEPIIGELMNKHHDSLRDYLMVSTPKIEMMIEAALEAGAYGCKITGSGNGGCMIAFCPGREKAVAAAIERVGAVVHVTKIVPGVSIREIN